ncbi:UNVERIFIED_CONTAM: Berberine bridge enzyme-like 8 [Sesamum latifolium]|uniref:Berberine bridge enzyme-like 8 n=1 Tax=Sesamum latifolium TaxID=2727402 RepID=A0AAW2TSS5_9LAMI
MLPIFFFFFFTNGILLTARPTCRSTEVEHDFLECLNVHSEPSQPISKVLYFPTNSSYSSVLQFYMRNLRFNDSTIPKPQLILTALHVSHIQAAVICAKSHALQMRIRSGGHDFEGVSYVSNVPFFILDMFNLRAVKISIEEKVLGLKLVPLWEKFITELRRKAIFMASPAGCAQLLGLADRSVAVDLET